MNEENWNLVTLMPHSESFIQEKDQTQKSFYWEGFLTQYTTDSLVGNLEYESFLT